MEDSDVKQFMYSQVDLNKSLIKLIDNQEKQITILIGEIDRIKQSHKIFCTPSLN
jgi:hypothetical protein